MIKFIEVRKPEGLEKHVEIWSCGTITTYTSPADVKYIQQLIKEAKKINCDVESYVDFYLNEY